ncbi:MULTISPECIES: CbtB domain-containing protein [Acetobacter]|uniref:CbtB domain-containing protein n=1 Tax=Acetobacter TaxID=434 RepID=UPI001594A7E0|nr:MULTISPECIES: CbtB-domain containing protein [Acetobacter]
MRSNHPLPTCTLPPVSAAAPIPVKSLLPWAAFGTLLFTLLLYFVGAEQGATSLVSGHMVHEFVHDGRHLLGFPCH